MHKYDEPSLFWLNLKEFPHLEEHIPKLKEIYWTEEERFKKARDLIGQLVGIKCNNHNWVKKYTKCIDAVINISSDIPSLKFTKYLDDIDIKELQREIKSLKTHIEFLEIELQKTKN
jgi:hypothetical protein